MTRKHKPTTRGGFRKFLSQSATRLALGSVVVAAPALAVERVWNTGFGVWGTQGNWSPAGFVGFGDTARIGNLPATIDAVVNMDINSTNSGVTIQGRARLNTEGRQLVVNGPTLIDGSSSPEFTDLYARLRVTNGASTPDYRTNSLTMASSATLLGVSTPTIAIDGACSLAADARLLGTAAVDVGGGFANNGEISVFNGNMTLSVSGTLDLDGSANNGRITINDSGSDLIISANGLTDAYDGDAFLGGGSTWDMQLANPWSIGPAALIQVAWIQSSGNQSFIDGAPLSIGGELQVNGTENALGMNAATTFLPTADIETGVGNTIDLNASATFNGGTFHVPDGAVINCHAAATVNAGVFNIESGGRVAFSGPTTVNGGLFLGALDSSSVSVRFDGPTTNWTGDVTFSGAVQQDGIATVAVPVTLRADYFDLDGVAGSTTVWNVSAPFVVNADHIDLAGFGDNYNGTFNLAGGLIGGMTIQITDETPWTMAGVANLTGDSNLFPTRIAGSPIIVSGDMNVTSGRVQIAAPTTLNASATINLPAANTQLRFSARCEIDSGATFTGPGLLLNGANGTMRLDDGVATDQVGLHNRGDLLIADGGAGVVTVNRFEQFNGASLRVSLGGDAGGSEHDLMVVSGPAVLAGALEVELFNIGNGQFAPQVGDEFTILTAGGGVSGAFDANPVSCAGDDQYNWTVVYEPNEVTLQLTSITAGHLGDMNCDCFVTVADIGGFVMALTNPAGFDAAFPDCSIENADVNQDGFVTIGDIGAFVTLLTQ
ncbi:MAG: hypothetical protein SF069_10610 [Phycisphaerae bacterium]|nr:hypothetical protein [Phycisphaerae bacterium]